MTKPVLVRITRVVDDDGDDGYYTSMCGRTKPLWMVDAWEWELCRWIPTEGSSGETLRQAISNWHKHCCPWRFMSSTPDARDLGARDQMIAAIKSAIGSGMSIGRAIGTVADVLSDIGTKDGTEAAQLVRDIADVMEQRS